MNPTFLRVHMLPARQGDCLWIEYGRGRTLRRILIDGGTQGTHAALQRRLQSLTPAKRKFELLVVTHIDSDHIGGTLPLLAAGTAGIAGAAGSDGAFFKDIWFNGWRHLPGSDLEEFGPVQGEQLTARLDAGGLPWNHAFSRGRICLPDGGPLPVMKLPGGLRLTLLSPNVDGLRNLRPVWEDECRKAGLVPGRPPGLSHPVPPDLEALGPIDIDRLADEPHFRDRSEANGSSIALLAEYGGKSILLAGDAYPEMLLASIEQLVAPGKRLHLHAFKLSHHGSKHSLNRALLEKVDCKRYLFSTDGTQFKHPDQTAVARVIKYGGEQPELLFNYRTQFNEIWDNPRWMKKYRYSVRYPQPDVEGLVVEL